MWAEAHLSIKIGEKGISFKKCISSKFYSGRVSAICRTIYRDRMGELQRGRRPRAPASTQHQAPGTRGGVSVDGGSYRRPIRVRTGCRSRGADGEWPTRSRVGRGLRSIPTPISSGLHQANHGVWAIVIVQRVSDDIRTPCRHATLRHPLLCKADR